MRVTRPSDNFTLDGYSGPGWDSTSGITPGALTFSGGETINPSDTIAFSITADTGPSSAPSANWTVEVSDDPGGASPTSCTGTLGTEISGIPDTIPPVISDITVSDVTDTSVKVTWTTDENATSIVTYGPTSSYGATTTGDSTTSHSIILTSLTANTTYHYQLQSVDSSGNSTTSDDNTFVTAKAAVVITATPTPSLTPTPKITPYVSLTPTPTPADTRPPTVFIDTDMTKSFPTPPTIQGHAADDRNIAGIEYSLDGGRNWSKVDTLTVQASKSAVFAFTPDSLEDDNYTIKVRAHDAAGNIGISDAKVLVIDRLPPGIVGGLLSLGPQPIGEEKNRALRLLAGLDYTITLSAVGGPVKIDVVSESKVFSLVKNIDNGLWTGSLSFQSPGVYHLKAKAIDGAGNKTEKDLQDVQVMNPGKIVDQGTGVSIAEAKVTIYYQEPMSGEWSVWDGGAYDEANPQITAGSGFYSALLPPGRYYMQCIANGYFPTVTHIFTLAKPTPINAPIMLSRLQQMHIGPFAFSLPVFSLKTSTIAFDSNGAHAPLPYTDDIVGHEAPGFVLPTADGSPFSLLDKRGKAEVLTFTSLWSPLGLEQIAAIEHVQAEAGQIAIVVPGENQAKVSVFRNRGGYGTPFIIDRDAVLSRSYDFTFFPTHYVINRKGIITHVIRGVLTASQIMQELESAGQE